MAQKLLVVLDFNGTILDSTHRKRLGVKQDCMARFKFVYFRPGMHQFLMWLFEQPSITVGLWTSNIAKNAHALVDLVFTNEQKARIAFVFTRRFCNVFPDYSSTKPMQTILAHQYAAENVIVVDDSPEKIEQSTPPVDYYHIPTFEASAPLKEDNELQRLQQHIQQKLDFFNAIQ